MHTLDTYLAECFQEHYLSHDRVEKRELAMRLMNDDLSMVMEERLHEWVDDTLMMLCGDNQNFVGVLQNTIDYDYLCDAVYRFLDAEGVTEVQEEEEPAENDSEE
jgi:hypothetical protein